ncbi:cyclic-di-AMP receptor [Blautia sp. XA-2221]|uniref:cyclic-di-AMP receptor n=1 Tax=Blautia sp. XA-2221 TaxID=2903961 RepID=UPI002379B515|nr:cyclic-di-AMP receptor [Blautia sp. XA-2221]
MKLIYAIVSDDDGDKVIEELNKYGYKVTKLSSTGGFLKRGNTTLMICTEDENVKCVIKKIEHICGKRHKIKYNIPCVTYSAGPGNNFIPGWYSGVQKEIEVGGAVIFAVDVCCYERI